MTNRKQHKRGGVGGNSGDVYNSTSNYDPYSNAPSTAHIMWTKPYAPGGLIGGEFGGNPGKL